MLEIVAIILALVLVLVFILSVSPSRHRKLSEIVNDLKLLKASSRPEEIYALEENIVFFNAIKTLPGYIYWATTRRRKLQPKKLLEIADLPLPRWEKELYQDLNAVERRKFPGLTKPLRNLLTSFVGQNKSAIILDLGCGGMEAERQTLTQLSKSGAKHSTVFVGIDAAPQAWDAIQENLRELKDTLVIKQIPGLNNLEKYRSKKPTVLFVCDDAVELANIHGQRFDMIFSSRFKHHLDEEGKIKVDKVCREIANNAIEYDDYRTAFSWLPPISTAWYRPILLNGAIFSQVRQPSKKELKTKQGNTVTKLFNPPGAYAKIYSKSNELPANP
jgi:SAM-dependent methyltransferase